MEEEEASRLVSDSKVPTDLRVKAAVALGVPGVSDKAFDTLAQLVLNESTPLDVRVAATRSIGQMGRRARGVDFLIGRFDYPLRLRQETVAALRELGRVHPVWEDSLVRDLKEVGDDPTSSALGNFGHLGPDPRIVAICIDACRDPRPQVRRSAVAALGMVGEFVPVIEALTDEDAELRAFAASMLGTHGTGDPGQVDALKRSLTDTQLDVRESARRALRLLGAIDRAKPPEHSPIAIALVDPRFDWPSLLEKFSYAFVRDRYFQLELPDEVVESGWLGYPGANEKAIAVVEERLGLQLPPSYRSFLKTSNGFRHSGVRELQPVERIERIETMSPDSDWSREPEIPDEKYFVYGPEQDPVHARFRYLPDCIAVSRFDEGDMYLLNPAVRFGEEWEAWLLSSRLPGANRYRSFWDLMVDEYRTQAPKLEDNP